MSGFQDPHSRCFSFPVLSALKIKIKKNIERGSRVWVRGKVTREGRRLRRKAPFRACDTLGCGMGFLGLALFHPGLSNVVGLGHGPMRLISLLWL